MPELPEMQALAERLGEVVEGAAFGGAQPLQFSALKTFDPPPEVLTGTAVDAVTRRGKYVSFELGDLKLLFHLSQGGRVDLESPPKRTRPKFGVVRLYFDDRPSILIKEFGTQRKAAWWVLHKDDPGPLERLGPEPYSREFEQLVMESGENRRVHTWLRDQRTVAGIGRGYTDDILHRARLSPYAAIGKLDETQRRELLTSVRAVLDDGL